MSDKEAQEDELLALASIFDQDVFSISSDQEGERDMPGGQFSAHPDLPQPFVVLLQANSQKGASNDPETVGPIQHLVKYLPPIVLYFELPSDYPSSSPPRFTISCKWLTLPQLSKLCKRLDGIWEENKGEVILFMWTSFLKDDALDYLAIQSPLDLTKVVKKQSKLQRTDSSQSGDEPRSADKDNSQLSNKSGANGSFEENEFDLRAIQDVASQHLLLPTILEHDKFQQEQDFRTTLFTCQVCFMEKLGALCISFPGCDHVYCKDCMRGYFDVQINDGNVKGLTCPNEDCDSQAHPTQVKELVSSEQFLRYDRLLLQSSLDNMSDIVYCPRKPCGCAVMVDQIHNMASCPACHYTFCIFCKLVFHGVSPCKIRADDVLRLRDEYNNADEAGKHLMERRYGRRAMKQILEESYSQDWLNEYSKCCPHCNTYIQKIDGCNKMTCTKCRCYFCWLCMQLLPRNNPYSHFNRTDSPCFNQLFQGAADLDDEDDFEDGLDEDEEIFLRYL